MWRERYGRGREGHAFTSPAVAARRARSLSEVRRSRSRSSGSATPGASADSQCASCARRTRPAGPQRRQDRTRRPCRRAIPIDQDVRDAVRSTPSQSRRPRRPRRAPRPRLARSRSVAVSKASAEHRAALEAAPSSGADEPLLHALLRQVERWHPGRRRQTGGLGGSSWSWNEIPDGQGIPPS